MIPFWRTHFDVPLSSTAVGERLQVSLGDAWWHDPEQQPFAGEVDTGKQTAKLTRRVMGKRGAVPLMVLRWEPGPEGTRIHVLLRPDALLAIAWLLLTGMFPVLFGVGLERVVPAAFGMAAIMHVVLFLLFAANGFFDLRFLRRFLCAGLTQVPQTTTQVEESTHH